MLLFTSLPSADSREQLFDNSGTGSCADLVVSLDGEAVSFSCKSVLVLEHGVLVPEYWADSIAGDFKDSSPGVTGEMVFGEPFLEFGEVIFVIWDFDTGALNDSLVRADLFEPYKI